MKLSQLLERTFSKDEVIELANEFKQKYEGPAGEKAFGVSLRDLYREGGNCSMISIEFCNWLLERGIESNTITGDEPVNKRWNDGDKGSFNADDPPPAIASHTVSKIGMWTVDFNAQQFDKNLPYPRIIKIGDFDSEWKHVHA